MGDWKLVYDMMGYGQMYNLREDPCQLKDFFNKPAFSKEQAALMAELAMWIIRVQDSLPTGPQNAKYKTKCPARITGTHPTGMAARLRTRLFPSRRQRLLCDMVCDCTYAT